MHPRGICAFLFLLAIANLGGASLSDAASNNVQSIAAVEATLNDALMDCDATTLGKLWAEDMTFVFPNGTEETRRERLEGLSQCVPGAQRSIVETVHVKDLGETTVALVLSAWSASINGKPFAAKFRATHVWAKRGDSWVLVAAHVSQLK